MDYNLLIIICMLYGRIKFNVNQHAKSEPKLASSTRIGRERNTQLEKKMKRQYHYIHAIWGYLDHLLNILTP